MATQHSGEPIRLEPNITIACVAGLHREFLERLEQETPITLDASAVERADAAAVQLFCALFRSAEARGVPCSWAQVSEPLREAVGLLGVTRTLGLQV